MYHYIKLTKKDKQAQKVWPTEDPILILTYQVEVLPELVDNKILVLLQKHYFDEPV